MEWLNWNWLYDTPGDLVTMFFVALGTYIALILASRLSGLRAYSKMASFDFAITVATGSIVASVVLSGDVPLTRGVAAIAFLFGLQYLVAIARSRLPFTTRVIDNRPRLLMVGSQMLPTNLKQVRVTEDEVREKLREANVVNYEQVIAVVMETTGDISVMHASPEGPTVDYDLFRDVEDAHLIPGLLEPQIRERKARREREGRTGS